MLQRNMFSFQADVIPLDRYLLLTDVVFRRVATVNLAAGRRCSSYEADAERREDDRENEGPELDKHRRVSARRIWTYGDNATGRSGSVLTLV